jgi:hypothetical protein
MRRVFRHVLIMTIAFALVASAAAWRQCTGLQLAAAAVASIEPAHSPGHHAQSVSHGVHDHQGMHHQHVADNSAVPGIPATDDHGCMKCCAMCTVATALLPAANAAVIFTVTSHVFSRDPETWSGNMVAVDPGIPKRIV